MSEEKKQDVQNQMGGASMKDTLKQNVEQTMKDNATGSATPAGNINNALEQLKQNKVSTTDGPKVETTKEFEKKDLTQPEVLAGRRSIAKKPIGKKTVDGKEYDVYLVREPDGTVIEEIRTDAVQKTLNADAKAIIGKTNLEIKEENDKLQGRLLQTKGGVITLQKYLQKFAWYICPCTPKDITSDVVVSKKGKKDTNGVAQYNLVSTVKQVGFGAPKLHILIVPERAYLAIKAGNTLPAEEIAEITSEEKPKMMNIVISKADFPQEHISVFGGYIQILPTMFDPDTASVASLADIKDISGVPGGSEKIYFEYDSQKIAYKEGIRITRKQDESDAAFEARKKKQDAKDKAYKDLASGAMTIAQRAQVIKAKVNSRSGIASPKNFLPLKTFESINVGAKISKELAVELNGIYLRKLDGKWAATATESIAADEILKYKTKNGTILDSVYFFDDEEFKGRLKNYTSIYKKRHADGTTYKPELTPSKIVKKVEVISKESGVARVTTVGHKIGEEGYNGSRLNSVKRRYDDFMATLDETQRCEFPTAEELVKVSESKPSRREASLSKTNIDRGVINLDLLMRDMSVGDGTHAMKIKVASENINDLRKDDSSYTSKIVTVPVKLNELGDRLDAQAGA